MTANAVGEIFGSEGLVGGTGGTKTCVEIVKKAGNQQGGGQRMSESMFKGITHTGLIVSDLETIVPFLCDVFEMEVKAELGLRPGRRSPR